MYLHFMLFTNLFFKLLPSRYDVYTTKREKQKTDESIHISKYEELRYFLTKTEVRLSLSVAGALSIWLLFLIF